MSIADMIGRWMLKFEPDRDLLLRAALLIGMSGRRHLLKNHVIASSERPELIIEKIKGKIREWG